MAAPRGASTNSVLFVCLGNICRSPIAEAVFKNLLKERGIDQQWQVDSAGIINMHEGRSPDERGQALMRSKGVAMNHRARQITKEDFSTFKYIFGMDEDNIRNIKRVKPKDSPAVVKMLGEYDPQKVLIIEDPYYGEEEGFETVFQQVSRCCTTFLDGVTK